MAEMTAIREFSAAFATEIGFSGREIFSRESERASTSRNALRDNRLLMIVEA